MDDSSPSVICAAAPLGERLRGQFLPVEETIGHRREERWKKWSQTLSRDDAGVLLHRLEIADIEPDRAKSLLGEVTAPSEATPPPWAAIFNAALGQAHDEAGSHEPTEESDPWRAFQAPFVATARLMLHEKAGTLTGRLLEPALTGFEKGLRGRLSHISSSTLEIEFAIRRAGVPGGIVPTAEERSNFARHSLNGGGFFNSYPVAARLIGLVVEFWVEAVAEFLQRLESDAGELSALFGKAVHGHIVNISAAQSDPHRRGRSVIIAEFEAGLKLVYKPRSVGLEAGWSGLMQWLNDRGCPVDWKVVRVLDRGDHGWMEFVSHEPCHEENERPLYFERAGGLLALLYALAGADMHLENLVAHGAHPVPIDLEVLMMPFRGDPNLEEQDRAIEDATRTLRDSVLNVGLLPSWVSVGKGQVYNLGGLGAYEQPPAPGAEPGENPPEPHQPIFEGRAVASHLYREEIVKGFCVTYEFLLSQRDALLDAEGPLARFAGEPVRFINRATSIYGRTLRRGVAPLALENGVVRSMEFEVFMKSVLHAPTTVAREVRSVCEAEILALEQGDVPFFQGRADSRDLFIPETGTVIENFFAAEGLSVARDRIRNLSSQDLELQTRLIHLSFDLMGDGPQAEEEQAPAPTAFAVPSFQEEALALAKIIREDAIYSGDSVTWIAPQMIPSTESFTLQLINGSLYDGALGVMVFLLAMDARLGDRESGKLGRKIFAYYRRSLEKSFTRAIMRQQPFGLGGFGGQIHALLTSARLSGDDDMVAVAARVGELMTEATLSRQKEHDIVAGPAGAIPSLLALHAATDDPHWRQLAIACGEHLLATREKTAGGVRSWKSANHFLAGYSHGAAGCAASLLRLHEACGDERFREAALEGIAYENTLFDAAVGNWRDLRFEGAFMTSWCHGAPGILLGRLLGGERDSEDVRRALRTTIDSGVVAVDQCCCGNAGKADILVSASKALGDDSILGSARDLMQRSIGHAHGLGAYRCYGRLPRTVRGPGFFQGLSGIGYTLLRLEFPADLPSVLAMET